MPNRTRFISRHLLSSRPTLATAASYYQKMSSTFNLPNHHPPVPVTLPPDLTEKQLLEFPAFKNWLNTLQRSLTSQTTNPTHEFHNSPYALKSLTIQSTDWFGGHNPHSPKRLGFLKLRASIENTNGESLPGSVFLRGPSVAMMIVLQPDDLPANSREGKHVILAVQPRIAAGSLAMTELPAGMVDDGTFVGAAAREIKEEIGLEIPEEELTDLTALAIQQEGGGGDDDEGESPPKAFYPSPGGCDEYISIFLHEKRVPREELKEWSGKLTGLRNEGEKITLKLVKLEEMWREGARDAKTLAAWSLYVGLRR